MAQSFITSGLHLNHVKCGLEWRGFSSLEEHNNFIIDSYNNVVKNKDAKVYILGDVVFQPATSLHLIDRLYGKKILIMGNHDVDARRYVSYFDKIFGYYGHDGGYIMSHIPIHPSQLDERFNVNLHGHEHISFDEDKNRKRSEIFDHRYFNVKCELHDYKPLTLDQCRELIEYKKEGLYSEYRKI